MKPYRHNENAGDLSERITIRRESSTADGYGGETITWLDVGSFWASVEPLSGRERNMADQTESPRDYRFIVRRSSETIGILAKDRLTWNGRNFNIEYVAIPDKRSQFLRIDAKEGVAI